MLRNLVLVHLGCVLLLGTAACGPNEGGGGSGAGGNPTTSSTGGDAGSSSSTGGGGSGGDGGTGGDGGSTPSSGWGEPDPGVSIGPIGHFKAFRSGCGEQLWMRFIPDADFGLQIATVKGPSGGSKQVTYFEVPVFLQGEKSVWLFSEDGGFQPGTYDFSMTVGNADGTKLTHSFQAPVDDLFRWPGQIDYVDSRNDTFNGLQVTIKPNISGDVQRIFLYDDKACLKFSKTFLSQIPITKGAPTEVDIGAQGLTTGATYTMVLQGIDNARQYVYYTTLDLPAP